MLIFVSTVSFSIPLLIISLYTLYTLFIESYVTELNTARPNQSKDSPQTRTVIVVTNIDVNIYQVEITAALLSSWGASELYFKFDLQSR